MLTFKQIYDSLPQSFRDKLNPEDIENRKLLQLAARRAQNKVVLDAGAGDAKYESFFSESNYIALDSGLGKMENKNLDIIADLYNMPLKDGSIDAILSTKVLEHVIEPKLLLTEFFRVLKPESELFMTVPFGEGLHMRPFDYFRYTNHGLQYLFEAAGFKVVSIKPLCGRDSLIGYHIRIMGYNIKNKLIRYIFFPFFCIIVPYFCYYLDESDKDWRKELPLHTSTTGWACHCQKI